MHFRFATQLSGRCVRGTSMVRNSGIRFRIRSGTEQVNWDSACYAGLVDVVWFECDCDPLVGTPTSELAFLKGLGDN